MTQAPEGAVVVTTDPDGVSVAFPDRRTERVRWEDLVRVVLETNDSGPWGSDVWWVLEGREGRCAYPQGATGEDEAMDAYKERLPGFDWAAMIRASVSTDNASFVCWEK